MNALDSVLKNLVAGNLTTRRDVTGSWKLREPACKSKRSWRSFRRTLREPLRLHQGTSITKLQTQTRTPNLNRAGQPSVTQAKLTASSVVITVCTNARTFSISALMNIARLLVPRIFVSIAYNKATTRKTAKACSLARRIRDVNTLFHQEIKSKVSTTAHKKTLVGSQHECFPPS